MQEHKYSIKEWAKDDQPREKLRSQGPATLSNSELLAILIRNGTRTKTAVEIARDLLRMAKDNLGELGKMSLQDLTRMEGIGDAKALTLLASLELGKRRQMSSPIHKSLITSSKDIVFWLQTKLKDFQREVFAVLFLNRANKINHFEIISEGGITGTVADPRVILKKALEYNAVSVILSHNHPSGSLRPSKSDQELTRKISEAASLLDIRVLDHIIIGESGYYSFADEGMI